jgi:hypothetical protein
MAETGDATAKEVTESLIHDIATALARTAIALHGARWVPAAPEFPKEQRKDAIASIVLRLTGWPSVDDATVEAIYRWLFGDEALYLIGTEMRLEAGQRILRDPALQAVEVAHPDTGELVFITRDEIREHGADDLRVLEAAQRYADQQASWHSRLLRVLEPYADDRTSVGDALHRAATDLGIETTGRTPEELAELVMAASEARGRESAG